MNNSKRARERQNEIRSILQDREVVSVNEFCNHFGASIATIRNDLAYLEGKGYLQRVKGGAMSCEGKPRSTAFESRLGLHKEAKERMAKRIVSEEIRPGMTVILDAGSTCYNVAKELLRQEKPCRVITTSNRTAMLLSPEEGFEVFTAGGRYDPVQDSWHGVNALGSISDMHADLCILSPDGVTDQGLTSSEETENEVKKQMLDMADRVIAAADGSKIGREGDFRICDRDRIDMLYTEPVRSVIRSIND